ncbi:MAG: hypothetical protein E6K83_01400 [Thaumarchaeota archaeon]|nr:MAG: hypothetical protein E6K83_01400 [Nitrososphaerota archaeon]
MNKFEQELRNGNFVCGECSKCNKLVWPPSDLCNNCFSNVKWRPISKIAKLVEFSSKNDEYFCIAEFENQIRVMGKVENILNLHVGQTLTLVKCGFDGKEIFVFELAD